MKLNLFCGTDQRKGYINIDAVEAFQPDLLWDLRKELPYEPESIEEIRIQDGFEHLNYKDAQLIVKHWINLLERGGWLFLQLPDWNLIDKNNLKNVFGEIDWKGVDTGDFGVHKWGYTKDSIRQLLENNSLKILKIENRLGNLIIEALKEV